MPKTEGDFIPKAVKKQADKANKKQQQAKDAKEGKQPEPTNPEPTAPTSDDGAIATEPVKPEPTNPEPTKDNKDDDFQHKYNVLQGMYNKETHELKTMVDNMKAQMESQQTIINTLNKALENQPAPQPAQQPAPVAVSKKLNANDFVGYGDEMPPLIDLVNDIHSRLVALEQNQGRGDVDPNLVKRLDRIEQDRKMSAQDKFYDAMNKELPDWGSQNKDPDFMSWLEGIDPISQVPRNVLLKHAFERWNSKQVLAIFNQYRVKKGVTPQSNQDQGDGEPKLGDQVVPETTGQVGDDPQTAPQVRYSTKEEFLTAQDHFTKGRMTEEDFNKIANSYQRGIAAKVNT